jgi:hypothetical protein
VGALKVEIDLNVRIAQLECRQSKASTARKWPLPDIRQFQKANLNTGHSDLKYFLQDHSLQPTQSGNSFAWFNFLQTRYSV